MRILMLVLLVALASPTAALAWPDPGTLVESPPTKEEIYGYFLEVFGPEGVARAWKIANCESGLETDAISPRGPYIGLWQFDEATFEERCSGSIWSWKDQTRCAKRLLDAGEQWRWPVCARIAQR